MKETWWQAKAPWRVSATRTSSLAMAMIMDMAVATAPATAQHTAIRIAGLPDRPLPAFNLRWTGAGRNCACVKADFTKNVTHSSTKQSSSVRAASAGAMAEATNQARDDQEKKENERAKMQLLQAVLDTKRGAQATADQRATIEEAMVGVEKFNAGTAVELDRLHGTWLLQYTTAPDVISLLQAAELPFLQVGQVYQKFDCKGRTDGGIVENIVRWSVPGLLQENEGATLIVTASFSVASSRSIVLQFEEARVGEIEISSDFQAFLAPAVLPRTFINLQILQFLRTFDVRVPLLGPQRKPDDAKRTPIGLRYYLTYLDNNMLLGRALGSGGIFVFSRTQPRRT